MATAKEGKTKTTTLCITWKEKWKSFSDEWKNNFKMCYCPCRINTYDSDSEEATADNETTFLLHRRDCEEAIKDESNFSLLNKRGSEEAIKDKSKVSAYIYIEM